MNQLIIDQAEVHAFLGYQDRSCAHAELDPHQQNPLTVWFSTFHVLPTGSRFGEVQLWAFPDVLFGLGHPN